MFHYFLFVDQADFLFQMVLVIGDAVHVFEERLFLGEADCGVDNSFLRIVLSEVSLNNNADTL